MQKRLVVCLCAVATLLAAANTSRALNVGSWDFSSGVENGVWKETFTGGGPGAVGNTLHANDTLDAGVKQWWSMDFTLGPDGAQPDGSGGYVTPYWHGDVWLDSSGPWGGLADTHITGMTAVNNSVSGDGTLDFTFHATGIKNGQLIDIVAEFEGVLGQNYQYFLDGQTVVAHGSKGANAFENITITISNVPDGGSSFALLGSGLIGLLALRRRM